MQEQLSDDYKMPTTVPWVAVTTFVLLAFGLAWLVVLPLWLSDGLANPLAGLLLPVMMFTPAIAALITVFLVQKPRPKPLGAYLGVWPLRPVGRTLLMIVIGIFGMIVLVVLGVFLAAALGLAQLDLVNFSGLEHQLNALSPEPIPIPMGLLVALQLFMLPAAALFNGIFAFGEELGWRGWLLPALRPLGTWPALLLTGLVWGLWHSPVILLGYNFNEPNLYGVVLMTVGCVLLGVLIGWLRLRSGSVWPAVFAHGAFNAAAGFLLLVSVPGTELSSPALSPLGWVTGIVMLVFIVLLIVTGQFKKQPQLVLRAKAGSAPA